MFLGYPLPRYKSMRTLCVMKTSLGQGRGASGNFSATEPHLDRDGEKAETGPDRQSDLDRIDAALRRLDLGRFGHCLYCGDQISMTRLDKDPAVESCSTCNEG